MGDCTAAYGETDVGIGIGRQATLMVINSPLQSALRTPSL
jgi:hypothetical protein